MNQLYRQHGIALPFTVMLLFVLTLVGVASLRTTLFDQDMTANFRLKQISYNAAETTLRDAEAYLIRLTEEQSIAGMRGRFFDNGKNPEIGTPQKGDTCDEGFCIPRKYDSSGTNPTLERWEDTALDVWNNPARRIEFSNYNASNFLQEGVLEAPRFIIEFLGNFVTIEQGKLQTNCPTDPATGNLLAPNNEWPFCATDPAHYRITVRATAGPLARRAVTMLQSNVIVP